MFDHAILALSPISPRASQVIFTSSPPAMTARLLFLTPSCRIHRSLALKRYNFMPGDLILTPKMTDSAC